MSSISNLGFFFCTVMIVDRGQVDWRVFWTLLIEWMRQPLLCHETCHKLLSTILVNKLAGHVKVKKSERNVKNRSWSLKICKQCLSHSQCLLNYSLYLKSLWFVVNSFAFLKLFPTMNQISISFCRWQAWNMNTAYLKC